MMLSRRGWLRRVAVAGGAVLVGRLPGQNPPAQGAVDRLPDPASIGAARDALDPLDNDPTIISTERRLRCTCGCTLDIYTCRTTDFTCTFSPELHREIKAMHTAGKTPEEIIETLVAREGPQMLMAPPAEGLNLAGYLLPGLSVTAAVLLLVAYLMRKRAAVPAVVVAPGAPMAGDADLDRLRRALDEVES